MITEEISSKNRELLTSPITEDCDVNSGLVMKSMKTNIEFFNISHFRIPEQRKMSNSEYVTSVALLVRPNADILQWIHFYWKPHSLLFTSLLAMSIRTRILRLPFKNELTPWKRRDIFDKPPRHPKTWSTWNFCYLSYKNPSTRKNILSIYRRFHRCTATTSYNTNHFNEESNKIVVI